MNLFAIISAIVICLPLAVTAQNCSCSPTSYTFQLNLTATYEDSTIEGGNPGITDTECDYLDPDKDTLIGGRVETVIFREYGVGGAFINEGIRSFNYPNLTDEGIVSFTSISDTLNTSLPLADQMDLFPGSVILNIFGVNANGEAVQNQVGWIYNTTNCDVEPLAVGDSIGWLTLVNYTLPKAAFCAAVGTDSPTAAPTAPPSKEPTNSPISPTATPTAPPSKEPTNSPISTTASPTAPPSKEPTNSPISPTAPPTAPPTPAASKTGKTVSSKGSKSKGSKSHGASAKSAKMAKSDDEIDTKAQKMSSKSHKEMMSNKNFEVVEKIVKNSGKDHLSFSFNLMEDDSMSYKARVPSTHVEKSPFGRRNGLRSHEE